MQILFTHKTVPRLVEMGRKTQLKKETIINISCYTTVHACRIVTQHCIQKTGKRQNLNMYISFFVKEMHCNNITVLTYTHPFTAKSFIAMISLF